MFYIKTSKGHISRECVEHLAHILLILLGAGFCTKFKPIFSGGVLAKHMPHGLTKVKKLLANQIRCFF